jgi:hypothetical protein
MENKISFNQRLSLIGIRIGFSELKDLNLNCFSYDIEETLIIASYEANSDFRLLSLLVSWVSIHGEYVIVEKLFKKLKEYEKYRGPSPVMNLLSIQAVLSGFLKWKKWITSSEKKTQYPIKKELVESSIEYQGLNEEFAKYGAQIPRKLLRIREADVYSIEELARFNIQYRNRLIYGASWRADIIAAIEFGFKNPSVIAKTIGCSYEPSHRIFKEYLIAKSASGFK